jgi:non-specific serine/threonine protein kinase
VGKTRLALAVAHDVAAQFHEGAVFVDLAPLGDPGLVLPTVARAVEVTEAGKRPLAERLVAALQQRHLLLVLDNCEHLLHPVAELVADLLTGCPNLQVLATSRAPLRIRGEQELLVEPLPLPADTSPAAPTLSDNPAVRLFLERAHAVNPRDSITADILRDIAEICCEVDGLPLAIELAAARVRVLPVPAIRDRLQRRLPFLTTGSRDAPDRQRTMRDTIAWSYDLLAPEEQAVFRRLAIFAGGFTLEAAQAVATHESGADVLPALERLVEHSLVQRARSEDAPRYHLLETVREFALEELQAKREESNVKRAHGAYFLGFAEQAGAALFGPDQVEYLARLETEHPNLRAALTWCKEQHDTESMLRLTAALWRFWFIRGHPREGRAWLSLVLAEPHVWSPALREALHGASMLAGNQGDHVNAAAHAERLLTLSREYDDDAGVARALFLLSYAATYQNDRDRALALALESQSIVHALGNPHRLSDVRNRLGIEYHNQGDYAHAVAHYEEAQKIWRELGCTFELVCVTTNLGVTAQAQGRTAIAAAHYRESLLLLQTVGESWMTEELLALTAALAAKAGDRVSTARLIGATDRLMEAIGFALAPFIAVHYERARASLHRDLGEEPIAAAHEAGRLLTRTQALSEAFAVVSALAPASTLPQAPACAGLSPREMEVLRLLVEGRSDRQIATALFISANTAGNHVSRILAKLGVESRTAAATFAVRHGLD